MPTLTLKVNTSINNGLVLSPSDIKNNYLFGVRIKNQYGVALSDEIYEMYIRAAQDEIEKYLNIKLIKQIFEENIDFRHDEWSYWGGIRTTYPVICPLRIDGFLGSTKQVQYPIEWASTRKSSETGLYHRTIYLVPVARGGQTSNAIYSGIVPRLDYYMQYNIPFYWNLAYTTGFDLVPADLVDVIGRMASINLFHIAGDLILGTAGIANQSIGIDGLSQSIGTTSSATNAGYGARILGYVSDLKKQIPLLKDHYRGFNFTVV